MGGKAEQVGGSMGQHFIKHQESSTSPCPAFYFFIKTLITWVIDRVNPFNRVESNLLLTMAPEALCDLASPFSSPSSPTCPGLQSLTRVRRLPPARRWTPVHVVPSPGVIFPSFALFLSLSLFEQDSGTVCYNPGRIRLSSTLSN